jgi:outer membrane protein OmpA-like peptidoglycan-associated protein
MKNRRTALSFILVLVYVLVLTSGCASKKFVIQEVSSIDQKVEDVGDEVENNQTRLREHDEKLATIGELIAQQDSRLKAVDTKVEEVGNLVRGHLIAKETLRSSETKFGFGGFELIPEAKAVVDAFAQKLIQENRGVFLEIQGHTDSTGPDEYNLDLGKKRAEAVREYLYKQHRIPLHRMEVISLGSAQPVADNSTRDGRAQNRRIEILVFE